MNENHVHAFEVYAQALVKCTVMTTRNSDGLGEKFLTDGWYDFVKSLELKPRDKIYLTVLDPVEKVCVFVQRRCCG